MKKMSTYKITVIVLAAVINLVGGQIALLLRLPIYLDSIGTILIGAVLGPIYGVIPGLISGILSGITMDIYALYFMPVQLITGLMAGLVFRTGYIKKWKLPIGAMIITIPGTIVSSCISAYLFGGVTSSGSSIIVLFLRKLGFDMVSSVFMVQVFTDYLDRILAIGIVLTLLVAMPKDIVRKVRGERSGHGAI